MDGSNFDSGADSLAACICGKKGDLNQKEPAGEYDCFFEVDELPSLASPLESKEAPSEGKSDPADNQNAARRKKGKRKSIQSILEDNAPELFAIDEAGPAQAPADPAREAVVSKADTKEVYKKSSVLFAFGNAGPDLIPLKSDLVISTDASVVPRTTPPPKPQWPDFLDFDRLWQKDEVNFCGERDGRNFAVACTIYSINNISDVHQTFTAKYRLLCNVAITESDFNRHAAMKDPENWKPSLCPHIRPVNASQEIKHEMIVGCIGELFSVQVAFNGSQKSWVAHFEIDCETEFLVPFDVRYCPFDVQELKMLFHVENTAQSFNKPRYWAQWHWEPPWTAGRFAITSMPQGDYSLNRKWIYLERGAEPHPNPRQPDQFHVCILAQRNWQFFFWRVMFVLAIINGVSCAIFLFTGYDEAMSYVSTMLVAIVTFLFVIQDMVPHVSYLTLLDYYVYGSFCFICCVALQIALVKMSADHEFVTPDAASQLQNKMGIFNVAAFILATAGWTYTAKRAWRKEQHRFDTLLQEEHSVARRASWTKTIGNPGTGRKTVRPQDIRKDTTIRGTASRILGRLASTNVTSKSRL